MYIFTEDDLPGLLSHIKTLVGKELDEERVREVRKSLFGRNSLCSQRQDSSIKRKGY